MSSRYGLEIRAADPADAVGLAELMRAGGQPVESSAMASRIEAIRQGHGLVLLAMEWGPPSGVVALSWAPRLQTELGVAHLSLLLVHPDARRRGVGRLLLKAASQAARAAGCGDVRLTATPEADTLRAFCAATGFAGLGDELSRPLRKRR